MRIINILIPFLVAAAVSGCAPTREEFSSAHTLLEGSPRIRTERISDCIKKPRTEKWIKDISDLTNAPKGKEKIVLCNRLYNGLATGRLTYEDIKSAYGTDPLAPNLIRVLQGR
jgi:hypothetical protein